MIELLLKLIDRLIDLEKYRAERMDKTFREILEPIFNDLMLVHSDYVRMFEEVQDKLAAIPDLTVEDGKNRLREIAESLRRQRLQFEPVRVKLAALTRELGGGLFGQAPKIDPPEAREFVTSVIRYFPVGNITVGSSRSSVLVAALRGAAEITSEQVERYGQGLPELVTSTINDCREKWSSVCDSYARLKIVLRTAQ